MTDNSYELFYPPYLNHPKTCPKNMNPWLPDVLSTTQQTKTDSAKIKMARHNQKYLGAHPEIKAIVSLILRNLFVHRPVNIHEFVGEFVRRDKFPDEIAQFLVEELSVQLPDEEDEDSEPKARMSTEGTRDHEARLTESQLKAAATHGDHRFLKKMIYGADPHSLRHPEQEGTHATVSYDQLLRIMRSSTSNTAHNFEEDATDTESIDSMLEEEDEDDEDEEDEPSEEAADTTDNEAALLEGQRLIFAMLGKTMTPSPSTSDLSMQLNLTGGLPKKHTLNAMYGELGGSMDGLNSANNTAQPRVSVYSEAPPGVADSHLDEEEEDEEYFEKD